MEHDQARPRTMTHKNNQVRKLNVLRNDTKISPNKHAKNISRRPVLEITGRPGDQIFGRAPEKSVMWTPDVRLNF